MKHLKTSLLLAGAATLGAASVSAALLVSEDFNYANGVINTQNGGTGFSSAWSTASSAITTVDGGLQITANGARTATRTLASALDAQAGFYFSYQISVTGVPAVYPNVSAVILDSLRFQNSSGTDLAFHGVRYASTLSDFYDLRTGNGSLANTTLFGDNTPAGTVITIVGHYIYNSGTDTTTLTTWINPVDQSSVSSAFSWSGTTAVSDSVAAIAINRADSNTIGSVFTTRFDSLLIGTTFADVTAIPEPSAAAALGGVLVLGAAAVRRRRR